jgi:hypothetical protein
MRTAARIAMRLQAALPLREAAARGLARRLSCASPPDRASTGRRTIGARRARQCRGPRGGPVRRAGMDDCRRRRERAGFHGWSDDPDGFDDVIPAVTGAARLRRLHRGTGGGGKRKEQKHKEGDQVQHDTLRSGTKQEYRAPSERRVNREAA